MKKLQLEYNEGLSSKLTQMREQKKTWMAEANALRSAKADLEVSTDIGIDNNPRVYTRRIHY